MTITKIFNVFNTLTLEPVFSKTKTFFKKLEYCFLVESTKIEKETFPYKTALLEANVKTNRIGSTRWTYNNERSFASNYFIFLEILFQFKICSSLILFDLMYQPPKCTYSDFSKALEFYLRVLFPFEYP